MENAYMEALRNRVRIGGMITSNDQLMLVKDLMKRMDTLEEKYEETTKVKPRNSKVSKRKTTSS